MPGPFLSIGGTVGGAFGGPYSGDNTRGLVAGGEFSIIWGWDGGRIPVFFGPFAEGLYDWHRKGGRATAGGVVGILIPSQIRGQSVAVPLGIDGGYAMDFAGKMKHGLSVRIFLFIGPIGPYVRYVALKDDPDYSEAGVMIKLPIPLYR